LSIAFGLLGGVGFAFFQEYLDNSVKTPDDVGRHLSLPTLGLIPNLESLGRKHNYGYGQAYGYQPKANAPQLIAGHTENLDVIAYAAPSSLMAEAYRSLRTSLLLSSSGHPPRTIVVTSASPSEGKTVTAVNLAISLTQTGAKVLLIDADMRRPRIHGVFSLANSIGLSSFLAGTSTLKDVIHETQVPGLMVIPCGITPPNPGELVLSAGFRRMLEALRQYFDYVVLDSPPVTNVSVARILGVNADSTVLVVKAFSTSRHHAREAVTHLRNANVHLGGVVLNDVGLRRRSRYAAYAAYQSYYSERSG
jgi:capsular exopolysaccharide synthesis family protein